MANLLIKTPYEIKGVKLNEKDLIRIHSYYEKAILQEYIYENANDNISIEDALKIAEKTLEYKSLTSWSENDCIMEARADLGFKKHGHNIF